MNGDYKKTFEQPRPSCRGARTVILGGHGRMGSIFADLFKQNQAEVLIVDEKTKLSAEEALVDADIVLFALPIGKTVSYIEKWAPLVPQHALLMDLTSLKVKEVDAMLRFSHPSVEVLGAHPLFGPYADVSGQIIVLTPARGDRWYPVVEAILKKAGLITIFANAEEHDETMSVVQGLLHAMLYSLIATVQTLDLDSERIKTLSTPLYKIVWALAERILSHDSTLYQHIALNNVYNQKSLEVFASKVHDFLGYMKSGDGEAFTKRFHDLRGFIQEKDNVLKENQSLIDFFTKEFVSQVDSQDKSVKPHKKNGGE